jgi:hypothetical protein
MIGITNPVTISGATYAWYPALGAFDPGANAYFDGYAGLDRVCLGAKSSGATDKVRMRTRMMAVYHSLA